MVYGVPNSTAIHGSLNERFTKGTYLVKDAKAWAGGIRTVTIGTLRAIQVVLADLVSS